MITLPQGFNYSLLVSDLLAVSLPFIVIGITILGYKILTAALSKL